MFIERLLIDFKVHKKSINRRTFLEKLLIDLELLRKVINRYKYVHRNALNRRLDGDFN